MTIALAAAVVLLAGAVVVLFAMYSELASRLPQPESELAPTPLSEAKLGAQLPGWPPGLERLGQLDGSSLLLALSTTCASCETVGNQLRRVPADTGRIGVVVASGSADRAADFVARHELARYPYSIDLGGDWLRSNLNVESSPVAVRLEDGVPIAAVGFGSLGAIAGLDDLISSSTLEVTA
ncbi:MAG TPA: hypothetical protein VF101_04770 [Gaiellaceae bacterium]